MEWLTALKLLTEAGNAETIADLQAQVNTLGQLHNGFVDMTAIVVSVLGGVICFLGITIIQNVVKIHTLRKKLDKLIPIIEQTANVKIV